MTSEERSGALSELWGFPEEIRKNVKNMLDQHAAEAIVEHEKKIDKLEADLKEANFKLYLIHQGLTTTCLNATGESDE